MTTTTNSKNDYSALIVHLRDLQRGSEFRYRHGESGFLNEEELAYVSREFPEGELIRYDGGYPGADKKKVIFLTDQEDDFSDIVCLKAETDQRFRKIGHRDVLGALMSLQIDRHSFGDLWVEEQAIYIYTSASMGRFICDNLIRIADLNVSFQIIDEHPEQKRQYERLEMVIASLRADAVTAALCHCSRSEAKEMIRRGLVQFNHVTLVDADEVCNNNFTISIRGTGRFIFVQELRKTRKDRIVAEFLKTV
ncbi:MAG: RNA-binding protein [Solobacterium sp.]|nr:RNA-binding protein [Solobacterium sp.]